MSQPRKKWGYYHYPIHHSSVVPVFKTRNIVRLYWLDDRYPPNRDIPLKFPQDIELLNSIILRNHQPSGVDRSHP